MNTKELMLGDWVNTRYDYVQVSAIYNENAIEAHIVNHEFHDFDVNSEIDWFDVIPLTPEILEKIGFEKREVCTMIGTKTHFIISDDYFDISLNEYTDSVWEFEYSATDVHLPKTRIFVSCLHQLQHALRLCGIEKTIEI